MKTAVFDKKDIPVSWYVIDAKDQVLGRISSKIASILQGKNKVHFSTFQDAGDNVIVLNAGEVVLTGKKAETKSYFSHSTYPGGGKTISYEQAKVKDATYPVKHAVKGMLPKNSRGRQMYKKLFVYDGDQHPHSAQKPEVISV